MTTSPLPAPVQLSPELERLARRRAGAKYGLVIHAAVFVAVNLAWGLTFGLTPGEHKPVHLPLVGWGLGLAIHGLVVLAGGGVREWLVERERRALARW